MSTTTVRRTAAISMLRRRNFQKPNSSPNWRDTDPTPTTVNRLSPDEFGKRVVIRSHDVIGTIYGTLLESSPHESMPDFTVIHLYGQVPHLLRNGTEVIVLDF